MEFDFENRKSMNSEMVRDGCLASRTRCGYRINGLTSSIT